MPTYEYVCGECGKEYEAFQSMKDAAYTTCPCDKKAPVTRKIGRGAGILFKGGGFYETDYKRAPAAKAGAGGDAAKGDGGSGAEAAKASAGTGGEAGKGTSGSGGEGGKPGAAKPAGGSGGGGPA